jgi:glycosyltransferase involved in cell wall biosynthesis
MVPRQVFSARGVDAFAAVITEGEAKVKGELLISIITSTRNAARQLPNAIKAMRQQSYSNFEWIIVDGASTDGTVDVIRKNGDIVDQWISEPDGGIYEAWNKGLQLARGEWICFLGADDWLWEPDVLLKFSRVLEQAYPPFRVVYGRVAIVNGSGDVLFYEGTAWPKVRRRFQSVMSIPHPGLMHHRSIFEEHGFFDPSFKIAGDYELLLRELRCRDARFVPEVVTAGMSREGISSRPEAIGISLLELRRATRKNGRLFPGVPWITSMARHILRRALWSVLGERMAPIALDVGRGIIGKPSYWSRLYPQKRR